MRAEPGCCTRYGTIASIRPRRSEVFGTPRFRSGKERLQPRDDGVTQGDRGSHDGIRPVSGIPLNAAHGFEYQHRNMGKPQGWVMLARTLAFEIGILLLALYI